MFNDRDDRFEVNDFDEDIKQREALIEEAKQLDADADWRDVMRELSDLKRRWKRIPYNDSAYEETLMEEFDRCLDVFYAKRNEEWKNAQQTKEEIIEKAKQLCAGDKVQASAKEMNELMDAWKAAGSAGRDVDDQLWDTFNAIRQSFYDRKHEQWEDMKASFASALDKKKELIQRAAALADSTDWQKTSEEYRKLMDEWKAAGRAGREHDDALWEEFQNARQGFYDRRNEHYEELHAQQKANYEAKKALIAQAESIRAEENYSRENTEKMKQLSVAWKAAGSCGRAKEDTVWKEFRGILDAYFDGLKQWNERRHVEWRQRRMEARDRKQELIANQKRQIKRIEDDIIGLLGERAIQEAQERIDEKKAFIEELEAELAEIEKDLAE